MNLSELNVSACLASCRTEFMNNKRVQVGTGVAALALLGLTVYLIKGRTGGGQPPATGSLSATSSAVATAEKTESLVSRLWSAVTGPFKAARNWWSGKQADDADSTQGATTTAHGADADAAAGRKGEQSEVETKQEGRTDGADATDEEGAIGGADATGEEGATGGAAAADGADGAKQEDAAGGHNLSQDQKGSILNRFMSNFGNDNGGTPGSVAGGGGGGGGEEPFAGTPGGSGQKSAALVKNPLFNLNGKDNVNADDKY